MKTKAERNRKDIVEGGRSARIFEAGVTPALPSQEKTKLLFPAFPIFLF